MTIRYMTQLQRTMKLTALASTPPQRNSILYLILNQINEGKQTERQYHITKHWNLLFAQIRAFIADSDGQKGEAN